MCRMTTVLVVDDHDKFRAAARGLVESVGWRVVGEAATGEDALAAVAALRPEVVLLDVVLPGLSGFEVAALLAARRPAPRVILVSGRSRTDYRRQLSALPAVAFLSKRELTASALTELVV